MCSSDLDGTSFPIRSNHDHAAQIGDLLGENLQAGGLDAVVIGDQDQQGKPQS